MRRRLTKKLDGLIILKNAYNLSQMPRLVLVLLAVALSNASAISSAQIRASVRLDKERFLAGEPIFVTWSYANSGATAISYESFDPYCPEPAIASKMLSFAVPSIFPYPHDGPVDCPSQIRTLEPGQRIEIRFLLNHRFNLATPGEYRLVIPLDGRLFQARISGDGDAKGISPKVGEVRLVLDPASNEALRSAYQPYLEALDSEGPIDIRTAVHVLADSGASFAETALLRFSSDPRVGSDIQAIANEGLSRLKGPAACARLAELAANPELHHQQAAISQLAHCADPGYTAFLFRLANQQPVADDSATRDFALSAAAELGGERAVDQLLDLISRGSLRQEAALFAMGLTGSTRGAGAVIDLLPSLETNSSRMAALQALMTLTHHKSRQTTLEGQAAAWKRWWADPQNRKVYNPRDWSAPLTSLD